MHKKLLFAPLLFCASLLGIQKAHGQNMTVQNQTSCILEMQLTSWHNPSGGQQVNGLIIPPGATAVYSLPSVFPGAPAGSFWAGFKAMNPCATPPPGTPGIDILGVEPNHTYESMSVTPCTYSGYSQTCGNVQAYWQNVGKNDVLITLK